MDLNFLSQADGVTLKYELAKSALEAAKANLETAKAAYDELLSQADEHGIPKAKLKKLCEDRVQALIESGLVNGSAKTESARAAEPKRERPKKARADSAAEAKPEEAAGEDEAEPYDGLSLVNAERNGKGGEASLN